MEDNTPPTEVTALIDDVFDMAKKNLKELQENSGFVEGAKTGTALGVAGTGLYAAFLATHPFCLACATTYAGVSVVTGVVNGLWNKSTEQEKIKQAETELKKGIADLFKKILIGDKIGTEDKEIQKLFCTSSKLADLQPEKLSKFIQNLPVDKNVLNSLINNQNLDKLLSKNYSTLYCKTLQLGNEARKDVLKNLTDNKAVKTYFKNVDPDVINLNNVTTALEFANKNEQNSLYPLYAISDKINQDTTNPEGKWDFLDDNSEKAITDILKSDKLTAINNESLNDYKVSLLKKGFEQATKNFSFEYKPLSKLNVKNNPDDALKATLKYANTYAKKVRTLAKQIKEHDAENIETYDKALKDYENTQQKHPDYIKQKAERELHLEATIYLTELKEPDELRAKREAVEILAEKYTKKHKRPTHVQAGLDIARFVVNNVPLLEKHGIPAIAFNMFTGKTVEKFISDKLDEFSLRETTGRVHQGIQDAPAFSVNSDEAKKEFTQEPPTLGSLAEATQDIPLPHEKILELLNEFEGGETGTIAKMSKPNLEALTLLAAQAAFDEQLPLKERTTLIQKLVEKAPKTMFKKNGYFADEKSKLLIDVAVCMLQVGDEKSASDFMETLFPKISLENYDGADPLKVKFRKTLSTLTEVSIDLLDTETEDCRKPLLQTLDLIEKDLVRQYKSASDDQKPDSPIFDHIDAMQDFVISDLKVNGYDVFDKLTRIANMSQSYTRENDLPQIQKFSLLGKEIFGDKAPQIFSLLIANSKRRFNNDVIKRVPKMLKLYDHKDFSGDSALVDILPQLIEHKENLSKKTKDSKIREQLDIIDKTHFGIIYQEADGDLKEMKRRFNAPVLRSAVWDAGYDANNNNNGNIGGGNNDNNDSSDNDTNDLFRRLNNLKVPNTKPKQKAVVSLEDKKLNDLEARLRKLQYSNTSKKSPIFH